jgi:hypothetical protein
MILLFNFYYNFIYLYTHMTKNDLKNIIKGLIIESINESKSKNFVSPKKTKKLKEQDEMQPVDPQTSAEPDAGEVEGPEPTGHELLLAKIDNIIQSLNDFKSDLSAHAGVPSEEPEGEEEMSDEEEQQA